MALILHAEKTNTRRFSSKIEKPKKAEKKIKKLQVLLKKHAGRSRGRITVRHQGGRHKRQYRLIDFKRNKIGIEGKIEEIQYDPNRTVDIALVAYADGDKRYILLPNGMKKGDSLESGERVEVKTGNAMKLKSMPVGTLVHNVEMTPGHGGQIGRSAGTRLVIQAKENGYAHLKMPSGEIRMISLEAMATVGALGNEEWKNVMLGKAGRSRHMGIRPAVRGVAQDPRSHAHGGGEAKSGVGRKSPMTKYGKKAVGITRNRTKYTNKYIVKRRTK